MSPDIRRCIRKAKELNNTEKRRWLGPVKLDSYGSESNRAQFYVLEGSPPRGYIIANALGVVVRYGGTGELLKRFYANYD